MSLSNQCWHESPRTGPRIAPCLAAGLTATVRVKPRCNRDALDQPLPVMAAANEQFKKAKALGLGESDFSAVYEAAAPAARRGAGSPRSWRTSW